MYCGPWSQWYVIYVYGKARILILSIDELKGQLLEMGICEVLIPLTKSSSSEVQGNSAAALGNLSSKGRLPPCIRYYPVLTVSVRWPLTNG